MTERSDLATKILGLIAVLGISAWVCGFVFIALHFVVKYW